MASPVREISPDVLTSALILVVEDDLELGLVTEEILTDIFGVQVVRAFNADEALHLIRLHNFDLVFTDIMMPGSMDGVQMAQVIREDYPRLPIILCTGNAPESSLKDSEQFPLLRKPYRIPELRVKFCEAGVPV